MKRIALAALASLALTAVGCAAANDTSADDSAALSEGNPTTTITRTISIDLKTDVTNLECVDNGNGPEDYSVQFDFQERHYNATHHIDFWGCQAERGSLFSAGVHTGSITEEKSDTANTSTIALDHGQNVFIAGPPASTPTTTTISFNLKTDTSSPVCRVEMGWWISFGFRGQQYQAYGGDDVWTCNGRLATVEGEGPHQGTLVEERHQTYVKRSITIDDGQWVFTSYEQL